MPSDNVVVVTGVEKKVYSVDMQRIRFAELGVPVWAPHVNVVRLAPGERTARHDHDFHELLLTLSGEAGHVWNGREDRLRDGSLRRIAPADVHEFVGGPVVFVNVAVSSAWWTGLGAVTGLVPRANAVELPPVQTRRLATRLTALATASSPLATAQAILEALDVLDRPAAGAGVPGWLMEFREQLDAPGGWARPLEWHRARAGVSPEHFARACRDAFGTTPTSLINRAKVERAKRLLSTTDRKVIAVADESGFENLSHFHRTFLREAGMTPRQWRTRAQRAVPRG